MGHDRSRPCAGQWRFTPVVRVGCHGNPSPYTYVHVKARTHVRVMLTLGVRQAEGAGGVGGGRMTEAGPGGLGWVAKVRLSERAAGGDGIPLPPLDKPNRSRCASAGRNSPSVSPPSDLPASYHRYHRHHRHHRHHHLRSKAAVPVI